MHKIKWKIRRTEYEFTRYYEMHKKYNDITGVPHLHTDVIIAEKDPGSQDQFKENMQE